MPRKLKSSEQQALLARVEELELRVKLLEARVRAALPSGRRPSEGPVRAARDTRRTARPRSRCPGCLQEVPPGRRGEACVWCGFRFDAVEPFKLPGA